MPWRLEVKLELSEVHVPLVTLDTGSHSRREERLVDGWRRLYEWD